jgi:hypothetical protein
VLWFLDSASSEWIFRQPKFFQIFYTDTGKLKFSGNAKSSRFTQLQFQRRTRNILPCDLHLHMSGTDVVELEPKFEPEFLKTLLRPFPA